MIQSHSFFWETITLYTFRFKTLLYVFIHLELFCSDSALHERSFSKIHNKGTLKTCIKIKYSFCSHLTIPQAVFYPKIHTVVCIYIIYSHHIFNMSKRSVLTTKLDLRAVLTSFSRLAVFYPFKISHKLSCSHKNVARNSFTVSI